MTTKTTLMAGIGQATTMYALNDLMPALRDALTDAATFRQPAFVAGNADADWATHHAALDVVTVRKAGTVTAADGFMLHQICIDRADVASLLINEEQATYWVHGTHIVRSPITSMNHAPVFEGRIYDQPLPYRVTLHPDRTTDDYRMFMDWLPDVATANQGLVLRGSLDRDGDAFAGVVRVSSLPEGASSSWAWETATFPWATDASEPRPWLVAVNAEWLCRLIDLRRGDGPIEIYLHATAPTGENAGASEEGMVFVRGARSTGVIMPMRCHREYVAWMERASADEEVLA